MNSSQNPQGEEPSKARLYLIIASVFLTLTALVWSLEASLVYIFSGIAVYFLFLYFWHRPKPEGAYGSETREDLYENLKRSFKQKHNPATGRPQQQRPAQFEARKILSAFFGFIIFVFIVTIFFVIVWSEDAGYNAGSFWLNRGHQFRSEGQRDSAKFYYRKAIREQPESVEPLFAYGNVLLDESDYDSAISYYDWALAADPYHDDSHYNKALAFYYQQRYGESREEVRQILEVNPSYTNANLLLGDTFYAEQNYDSAIQWYETGYEEGARSGDLCHVMAYIYDQKGDTQRAIPFYEETLYYDSTRVEVYNRLAELVPEESTVYRALSNRYSNK